MKTFIEFLAEKEITNVEACKMFKKLANRNGIAKTEAAAINGILIAVYENFQYIKSEKKKIIDKFVEDIKK